MTRPFRPTVFLLHGLLATSYAHFSGLIARWRHRLQVVPLDLPGHGRCPENAAQPYYQRCVTYLSTRMAEIGPGHVIGASYLGSSVALRACLSAPARFQSLVLSGYVPEAPHSVVHHWTASFIAVTERDPELVDRYQALHGTRWRQTLDTVLEEIREAYPTAVAVTKEQLASLQVPTLLLNGSLKSDERAAAADVPSQSSYVEGGIIPGAGHIPSYDQPELFAMLVEDFWERVERRGSSGNQREHATLELATTSDGHDLTRSTA